MSDVLISVSDGLTKKRLADQNDGSWAEVVTIGAARVAVTASIPNAGSVTPTIDLGGVCLVGFIAPADWTAAALNIDVSVDNSRWISAGVYDSTGVQTATYPSLVANSAYSVDMQSLMPFRYVRFRSGTSAVPVAQAAQRDFAIIARPLA